MNSESPNPHGNTPQASGVSSDGDAKRKAGPDSGTQTRAKRNRYISIAWYDMQGSPDAPSPNL